jgi:hypothetical protein
VTLSVMSDSLSLPSSCSMFGVLLVGVGYRYVQDYNIIICNCLPLTLTLVNVLLVYACSSL